MFMGWDERKHHCCIAHILEASENSDVALAITMVIIIDHRGTVIVTKYFHGI